MSYFTTVLLLLLVTAELLVAKERGRLSLSRDGSYANLVIAIDRSLPEDPAIVENIKAMVLEFSQQLGTATRPMFSNGASLRLGQAFILVPKTWTNRTQVDAVSTWQTFDNADIRMGRSPGVPHYTYHGGGCGKVGDFVVFDTEHVQRSDAFWLGKQMLTEFGQFRWGLRSETNGESGPHHYLENTTIVPNICTKGIKGAFRHNETQQACRMNANTLELELHCRFYPEIEQEAKASLLGVTVSRDVEHFCEDWHVGPDELRHNTRAEVPLTRICRGYSSARHVMRRSESGDFNVAPTQNHPTPPPVQFTIVRPMPFRRLSIVIDVSSSMGGDPLNKIKTGLDKFILDMLEQGIACALVTFNHVATVVKPLGILNTNEDRAEYAKSVRGFTASGYTAIGDGLVLGMQAADVLRKTSIIVDTVTFGPAADKRLTQLSEDTNGYSFFCRFQNSTNDFLELLSKTVRDRVESKLKPIDLFSAPIDSTFSIPVHIDSSVGQDTSFLLTTYRAADIVSRDLRVLSPSRKVYDKTSSEYVKDSKLGTVTIRISGQIETGQWTVTDGTSAMRQPAWSNAEVLNTRAALTVTSKPASHVEPVILDGSVVGETEINLNRSTEVVIGAALTRGAQLLRGAKILAKIESESSVDAVLQLQDNGVYPDVQADDGIYSALVPSKSIMKVQEYNLRLISESPYSRVTSAGKIFVKSVDTGSLRDLPPATVQDLKAAVDLATETVLLSWTAVGNEQNDGAAAQYIIKSSANATEVQELFHSAKNVSVTVVPLPAGSPQSVNISSSQMPSYNSTFYMAVLAVSSNGVASAVSNIVSTQLKLPDNIGIIDGTTTTVIPEVLTTTRAGSRHAQSCGVTALLLGIGFLVAKAAGN